MKKNICSDSLSHYKVHIPAKKLPSSLAQELCSPLWRNIIQSIENNDVDAVFKLVERIGEQKEKTLYAYHTRSTRKQTSAKYRFAYGDKSKFMSGKRNFIPKRQPPVDPRKTEF